MAKIKHIKGNALTLHVLLGHKEITHQNGNTGTVFEEFYPNSDYPTVVTLKNGVVSRRYAADVTGNSATIQDKGFLPLGTYAVEVTCRNDDAIPMRFSMSTVIEVVNDTADGGQYSGTEFDVYDDYLLPKPNVGAVIIADGYVNITEGFSLYEDQDPSDDYADINAGVGEGSISINNGYIDITI